jgi:hypothetical protein
MRTLLATASAFWLLLAAAPTSAQSFDAELAPLAADATARGCDVLDSAHCLYPFPGDWFTQAAPAGSPQSVAKGGTGRRVNLNPLAMPQNIYGRRVDPTEWNRNDGFSPGQLIVTYVPGLDVPLTYGAPAAELGPADVRKSLAPNAPVVVLRVDEDAAGRVVAATRHLSWAEPDANADVLVQSGEDNGGLIVMRPSPAPVALLIRPAVNFSEGKRYVVALRNLKDGRGAPIRAATAFRVCRDRAPTLLPQIQARCAQLEQKVFPALKKAGIARDESLYLAWDFTVASTNNQVGRLRAMRDTAFATLAPPLAPGTDCTLHADGNGCAAPGFTVDTVLTGSDVENGIYRQIQGTITVPSFVLPVDPSPLEDPAIQQAMNQIQSQFPESFSALFEVTGIGQGASAPPNRLFYNPTDAPNPGDPQGSLYGDGLPDSVGTMTTRYMCQIPQVALTRGPAKAGIYGHGLLDSRVAITYDGVDDLSREHDYMFCAVDWFGFATGDLPNVATTLIDLSFFPVVPDGTQQGILNFAFLARLLRHPDGFASHPAFQDASGAPLFDRSAVYYDGNSQGGILGGAVIAISKDVQRGILGSLGANYSLLLRRSQDFDLYSVPLYTSYTDALDRNFLFSLIQMLWDRGENNGYAAHLTDTAALGGPPNTVLLHSMFGDHEVTMWSADIMARTMGIPANYDMVDRTGLRLGQADRHPDLVPGFGLTHLDFTNAAQAGGSGLIQWDGATLTDPTAIPPVADVPNRVGRNPHDDSAKRIHGRCHKALFLRPNGQITDPTSLVVDQQPILVDGQLCPP